MTKPRQQTIWQLTTRSGRKMLLTTHSTLTPSNLVSGVRERHTTILDADQPLAHLIGTNFSDTKRLLVSRGGRLTHLDELHPPTTRGNAKIALQHPKAPSRS